MRALLPLVLLLLATAAPAQPAPEPTKYWVFFTDKHPAQQETSRRVAVSAEAKHRRARRGTPRRPADLDVPVPERYVAALQARGIEPVVRSRWFNAVSAYLAPEQVAEVRALPFVRAVRPVARTVPERTALAPRSPVVVDYGLSAQQLATINADAALEAGYDGTGIVVGFLDTTFDFEHPALQHLPASGRLLGVQNFTGQEQSNSHGLSVASVAVGYDPGQLVGPGHGAAVLAATTEYAPTETRQEEDFFVAGLEWLEQEGADVVNVSLGYSRFDPGEGDYTYADMNGDTALVTRAADLAAALGVVVVTSAGNEGGSSWQYITAPADADSVIAVGAVRPDSSKASFSSVGPTADGRIKPDVAAMGTEVWLALPGGFYTFGNGTSFSAPLVAGVVAQLLQANPDLDPIGVRTLLRATASQAASPDTLLGWGVVNAFAALQLALDAEAPPQTEGLAVTVFPNPAGRSQPVTLEVLGAAPAERVALRLYDLLGREVAVLHDGPMLGRLAQVQLPALASGLYVWQARSDAFTASGRLVVL